MQLGQNPRRFARERHDSAVPTVFASDAKKAVNWNAATKVCLELVKHEGRQFASPGFAAILSLVHKAGPSAARPRATPEEWRRKPSRLGAEAI
jgi:hypothetical protein